MAWQPGAPEWKLAGSRGRVPQTITGRGTQLETRRAGRLGTPRALEDREAPPLPKGTKVAGGDSRRGRPPRAAGRDMHSPLSAEVGKGTPVSPAATREEAMLEALAHRSN
jgi:hypothetical protein